MKQMPWKITSRKIPEIICDCCNGKGLVPLSREMWDTLQGVRAMKAICSADLAAHLTWPGHVTAINNRLVKLMKLGFHTRHKAGKMYVYKLA